MGVARTLLLALTTLIWAAATAAPTQAGPLQDMIDATPDGGEVVPPAGTYVEHITIDRNITLDGRNGVVIDGGGEGTVVTLSADSAALKNVRIINSGRLHNKVDAGLRISGNFNVIRDVSIENSLFGIDMTQASNNVLRRIYISSKDMPLELRGDSIRIWYSNNNKLEDLTVEDSRDIVIWYSEGVVIRDSRIRRGRYGIHFMYAHNNTVEDNEITDCVVGVFLMYANHITVQDNDILRSWGASGVGIGFKESSGAVIARNNLIGNAAGIYLDPSPWDPDMDNHFDDNVIAYNGVGIEFHTEWKGNHFRNNSFVSNFTQISVRGRGHAMNESWEGNYWDDYAGFDKDGDRVGDVPYEIYNYADRIWMERPHASFFRGGLALATLDFIERLAPFSEPRLLMREEMSLMDRPVAELPTVAPRSALEMLQ